MIRMYFIWLFLFILTFLGLGTWKYWKLKVAISWLKITFQAFIASLIVTLFLTLIVFIF